MVAQKSGAEADAIQGLRSGDWNEATARKVAPALGLGGAALAASGNESWAPQPVQLDGLAQFNTPYEDLTVNSYLVWDPATGEAQPAITAGRPVTSGSVPTAHRARRVVYAPDLDGRADPGEIVWTWVVYEEDPTRGKDRPVLVVAASSWRRRTSARS